MRSGNILLALHIATADVIELARALHRAQPSPDSRFAHAVQQYDRLAAALKGQS